ncbi:MAG: glycosyltransferase [Calditrichaeota bacterium]|nr:MAG: glycosyltransferase [Calditrichota bacterium]
MGGAVGYMQFLLEETQKRGLPVRFIGVELLSTPRDYPFIPIQKKSDSWQKFLVKLFLRAPFLKFVRGEIVHVFRIAYAFPILLFHRQVKVVCVSAEPLAAAAHRYPHWLFKIIDYLFWHVERFVLKRLKALCTTPDVLSRYFFSRHPALMKTVLVHPSTAVGIDLQQFTVLERIPIREKYNFTPDQKIMLFVGRLAPVKRVDFLLKVFKQLHEKEQVSHFIIVGDGEERERLQRITEKEGIPAVHFWGEVSKTKLPEVYNLADVLVLASETEGNPTVVREALACGLPVVSTAVGDVPEILDNPYCGAVVPSRDVSDFQEAIAKVLALPREKVNSVCRKKAMDFSREALFEELVRLYNS